jgi:hypothetical protein
MRARDPLFHLCKLAAVEQNREKLLVLFQEIGRLLDWEEARQTLTPLRGDIAGPLVLHAKEPHGKNRSPTSRR